MPAMPLTFTEVESVSVDVRGLTKREYIAAMAMQGMLANQFNCSIESNALAKESISYADALLKQLEESKR